MDCAAEAANGAAHAQSAAADGSTTAAVAAPEASQPDNPLLTQLNELWAAVKGQDADDFTTWTTLVSTAEKLNDLQQMRAAYDAFLAQYPLCYGYWKKYAEAERRQGSSSGDADGAGSGAAAAATAAAGSSAAAQQAAAAVYERGVAAVPHSTELWVAYAALLQASDAPTDTVRSVYEAAAAAAGGDYTSGLLWDKFLAYEAALGSPSSVAALYARVLACPVKDLDKYHTGLTNYASSRTAAELLPEDTVAALKAQLEEQAAVAAAAAAAAQQQQAAESAVQTDQAAAAQEDAAAAGAEAGIAAGTAAATAAADDGAASSKPEAGGDVEMSDAAPPAADAAAAESAPAQPSPPDPAPAAAAAAAPAIVDDAAVKAAWLAQQYSVYQATKQQLAAIQGFEAGIRRPYWHYKPLDGQQLQNWVAYLDWQQRQGDAAAVQRLFERCLVPCANYPEFWMRHVCWCQAQASSTGAADSSSIPSDAAAAVLARALGTFCRRNPKMVLFAARFYEAQGDSGAARAQYTRLLSDVAPGLFEGVVAFANFEHRASGPQAAKAVYKQAVASSQQQKDSSSSKSRSSGSGGGGSSSSSPGFLYVLYANFLRQVSCDLEAARGMLSQGLELHPACRELWDAALGTEETLAGPDRVERVLSLYAQLLQPKADAAAKQQQQQPTQPDAAAAAPPANGSAAAVNGLETQQTAEPTDAPAEATNGPAAAGSAPAAAAADASSSLPDDVLEEFSQRCVEFADMHADLKTLQQVQDRHMQLFPLPATALAAGRQRDTAATAAGGSYAATAATAAAGAANGYASAGTGVDAAAAAAMDPAAAYGYYPPAAPGGYYPPSHHYPSHGGYPPAHHYGPPAHHWGYGYGAGHY